MPGFVTVTQHASFEFCNLRLDFFQLQLGEPKDPPPSSTFAVNKSSFSSSISIEHLPSILATSIEFALTSKFVVMSLWACQETSKLSAIFGRILPLALQSIALLGTVDYVLECSVLFAVFLQRPWQVQCPSYIMAQKGAAKTRALHLNLPTCRCELYRQA